MCELSFLEICGDPYIIEGHNRQQRLPGLHVHANFDILVHHAAHRRSNRAVLQIQFGLRKRRAFFLDCRERRLRPSAGRTHLLRSGARIAQFRFGLAESPLSLGNLLFGAGYRRPRSVNGRSAGLRRCISLIVDLPRDFIFRNELLVARHIGLGAGIVGFGLLQLRPHCVGLPLRCSDACLHAGKLRFRRGNLAGRAHSLDGHIQAKGARSGFCVGKLGFGMVDSNLIIPRIDLNQHRALVDVLVVFDVYTSDVSGNAGTDGVYVAIHLRIVGGLVGAEIAPDKKAYDCQHHDDSSNQKAQAPPGFRGRQWLRSRKRRGRARFFTRCGIRRDIFHGSALCIIGHGLLSLPIFADTALGGTRCASQLHSCEVVCIQT